KVALFNWFLFSASFFFLLQCYGSGFSSAQRLWMYALGVSLPTVASFMIPYTEAVFFFSGMLWLCGLKRHNLFLLAVGGVLLGLSRPAVNIIIVGMLCVLLVRLIATRQGWRLLRDALATILPIVVGVGISIWFQMEAGKPAFYFMQVQREVWEHGFSIPGKLNTWSPEGQALELFAVFSIGACLLYDLLSKSYRILGALISGSGLGLRRVSLPEIQYIEMFLSAVLLGQIIVIVFWQHSNIHGMMRYEFANPFFYAWSVLKLRTVWQYTFQSRMALLGGLLTITLIAWLLVAGNDPQAMIYNVNNIPVKGMQIPHNGLPWMMLTFLFAFILNDIKLKWRILLFSLVFVTNAFYVSYLMHAFIARALIWT
ncbi:MAG: hypothetical protein ACOCZ8_02985, partial [Bacteroidota bacterium]